MESRGRERVETSTSENINRVIKEDIYEKISASTNLTGEEINELIAELDTEWDIERMLEFNAGVLALSGTLLGLLVNKKWFALPAVVTAFLIQHAVQGWCPPLPFFRRLGFRTRKEIEHEKHSLKAMRGDYEGINRNSPEEVFSAAEN
jgi:hypothetical protein